MIIRFATKNDIDGIIKIVKAIYGDNYWNQNMYNKDYIEKLFSSGKVKIVVAEYEGELISMMTAEIDSVFEGTLLLRSLMTIKDKRFKGSSQLLHKYFFKNYDFSSFESIYLLPVTGHSISQTSAHEYGFRLSGALMNAYKGDVAYFVVDQSKELLPKRTNLLAVLPVSKKDVGTLYLPKKYFSLAEKIYDKLEVSYKLSCENSTLLLEKSIIEEYEHKERFNTDIIVRKVGKDCINKIKDIINLTEDNINQTFQIFINILNPSAVFAINKLVNEKFVVTGFKPLGKNEEYIILYYSKNLPVNFTSCELTEENKKIINLIMKDADL